MTVSACPRLALLAPALVSLAAACTGGTSNPVPAGDAAAASDARVDQAAIDAAPAADAPGGESPGPDPANGAPVILASGASASTLTPGQSLTISVVATDPDGIDDLIGGVVTAPRGPTYGALSTAAQEGSYALTLSWAQLHATVPIEAPPGGAWRTFGVSLYDVAGASVQDAIDVVLACGDPALALCDAACTDLDTDDDHCGACDWDCGDAHGGTLVGGVCEIVPGAHDCHKVGSARADASTGALSCDELCAAMAGPAAYAAPAAGCNVIDSPCFLSADCGRAYTEIPAGCADGDTFIACQRHGFYRRPAP